MSKGNSVAARREDISMLGSFKEPTLAYFTRCSTAQTGGAVEYDESVQDKHTSNISA